MDVLKTCLPATNQSSRVIGYSMILMRLGPFADMDKDDLVTRRWVGTVHCVVYCRFGHGRRKATTYKHERHSDLLDFELPSLIVCARNVPPPMIRIRTLRPLPYLRVFTPNCYCSHLSFGVLYYTCLLYTSPSPRDRTRSRMPSSA